MAEIDELSRKIAEAKSGQTDLFKSNKKSASGANDKAGVQAGLEFAMCIGLSTFFGYHIDGALGSKPLFLILLFFLGVGAGFWTLYKYSLQANVIGRNSQLPEAEKTSKRSQKSELNSFEPLEKEE